MYNSNYTVSVGTLDQVVFKCAYAYVDIDINTKAVLRSRRR